MNGARWRGLSCLRVRQPMIYARFAVLSLAKQIRAPASVGSGALFKHPTALAVPENLPAEKDSKVIPYCRATWLRLVLAACLIRREDRMPQCVAGCSNPHDNCGEWHARRYQPDCNHPANHDH